MIRPDTDQNTKALPPDQQADHGVAPQVPVDHGPANQEAIDHRAEEAAPSPQNDPEVPISDQLEEIADEVRLWFDTEMDYYRAKLDVNLSEVKRISGLFGVGLAIGTAGLTALIFGLLLSLSKYLGPIVATIIVVSVSLIISLTFLVVATKRGRKLPIDEDKL